MAHELGELKASLRFGKITQRQYTIRYNKWLKAGQLDSVALQEMQEHTDAYVEFIASRRGPKQGVFLEQRLFSGIESCWGTSDTVIVGADEIEIIDLKYGLGVRVGAWGNPQLRLYGLGALDTFGDLLGDVQKVTMTVFQPRLGNVDSETLTADELRAWREEIRPIAADALAGSIVFGPSESACRWCPVAGECKPRMEIAARQDFALAPELLSVDELAAILEKLPLIKDWVSAVEAHALDKVYSQGEHIPGWKVVLSGGRRGITNEVKVAESAHAIGYKDEDIRNPGKLKGLGDLEKIMGKEDFGMAVAPFVAKSEGKPSLVPDADHRPSTDPNTAAGHELAAITEGDEA